MAPQKETSAQDWQETNRATRRRVALILSYNLEFCEFQQQLFRTCIAEGYGGLGILTRTLNLRHRSHTKALVLYRAALMQIAGVGV